MSGQSTETDQRPDECRRAYWCRRARWLAAGDQVVGTVLSRSEGRVLDGVRGSLVQVFVPDPEHVTPSAEPVTCKACHGRKKRLHGWAMCPAPCADCNGTGVVTPSAGGASRG